MNILVLSHYGNYDDLTYSFTHNQAKEYVALGHRVRAIIPIAYGKSRDGERFEKAAVTKMADGVELVYLRHISFSNFGEKLGINLLTAKLSVLLHRKKLIKGFSPDVIHAHTLGFDSRLGRFIKRLAGGCPLVVTTHGSDAFVPYNSGKLKYLRDVSAGADQIVAVSSKLKKILLQAKVKEPVDVVLNGFSLHHVYSGENTCQDASTENSQEFESVVINQTGYLVARKKNDTTIRAFAEIKNKYPNARLVIVGNGSEMEVLIQLCQELDLSESVEFKGILPNKETIQEMKRARFFVMPSVNEGFGIVYLEAMASGCITIGTENEGIADFIASGVNGFLVPRDSPEKIAQIIDWCLENPSEAEKIALRGKEDALAMTWRKNALQYEEIFRSLSNAYHIY